MDRLSRVVLHVPPQAEGTNLPTVRVFFDRLRQALQAAPFDLIEEKGYGPSPQHGEALQSVTIPAYPRRT